MEFANYHLTNPCSLILFSSAWLDPNSYPNDQTATFETINYWANRLIPIIKDTKSKEPCYFVCSNRVGTELGETYMGSSCIMKLRPQVELVANLSKKEQNTIVATLTI
jgi:predicted amidohydrolase